MTQNMSVCLINALFPPEAYGGAENYVKRTANELSERGYDVSIITTKKYDGLNSLSPTKNDYEGIPIWRFYPLNLYHRTNGEDASIIEKAVWHQLDTNNLHSKKVIKDILDRIEPDIIHTNNLTGISTSIGKVIHQSESFHVHTLHDYSLICPKSNMTRELTASEGDIEVCKDPPIPCRIFSKQKQSTLGQPDLVLSPSQHVLDVHQENGIFRDVPCRRLRLGIESINSQSIDVSDNLSVLYVGKQMKAKGIETLFDAAQNLPEITFHVCGTGPFEDETKRMSDTADNFCYHGYVSEAKLEQLRSQSRIAIVPSIWMENSPFTIYESFASGLPVIGSQIGGIPELVEPGERGDLFTAGDPGDLAESISELITDEKRLQLMSENAIQWAKEHTIEKHVDRLLNEMYPNL